MVPCKVEPVIYTSLREILSTKVQNSRPLRCELVSSNSPRTPIKNRLVEQAARAYLQPAVIESNQQENFKSWYWQKLGNCMPIASALKRCWTGAIKICSSVSSCLQELNWALLNWLKPPKKFH
ncbi:hypothetical protein O6H91_Y560200 [Diphasiastrum complanatum]|nr:hypothetical protein O6H91_Y560200 [Diphasiastrum complanatum]